MAFKTRSFQQESAEYALLHNSGGVYEHEYIRSFVRQPAELLQVFYHYSL